MPMVEEFELLEETEVQFEDSDCAESVWHGVGYCKSLFCRKKPAAELTLVIRKEGILYFLCADLPEFQELCRLHGWYVVSHHPFSATLEIGMCIMEAGRHAGWYSLGHSSERNAVYRELLEYTFERSERQDFYPYETSFKGQCVIDGCTCHYLHDYHPTWMEKKDEHQKRVSNLIFRFKEGGHCGELVAQILAFALLHAGFEKGRKDTVLIPVPASTRERQRKRFPVACYYLSRELGIEDGYKAIWIAEDREQLKGREKSGGEILSNLQFTRRYIRGKHIVLLDDVLTTGTNFLHLSRKMKELGAVSVTGVFLGKTVGGL